MPPQINAKLEAAIEDALVDGLSLPQLMALVGKLGFSESERTVQRYMARIRKRWAEESAKERPELRAEHRARCLRAFHQARSNGDLRAASSFEVILAKIDGVFEPVRIEVSGRIAVAALSPMERQHEINELLRRKAEHLDGRQAGTLQLPESAVTEEPVPEGSTSSNGSG